MKKLISAIIAIMLLVVSVAAFAEENPQGSAYQDETQVEHNTDDTAESPEGTSKPERGRKHQKGASGDQGGDADAVSGATIRGKSKPDDQEPSDGQLPGDDQQAKGTQHGKGDSRGQNHDKGRAPGNGSDSQGGQNSGKEQQPGKGAKNRDGRKDKRSGNSEQSQNPNSTAPLLDLDALVAKAVISQETADRISAYMQEHPLTSASETDSETAVTEFLKSLLNAEIITQTEYDGILAEQASTTV